MFKRITLKQNGFTLIELLVAMAIAAILLTAVVTLFRTSTHMNSNINNQTNATNQLKNAFNYINRDAEEAGSVIPTTPNQFPLTLSWIQNNIDETIIYSISNSGVLQRSQLQSGVLQSTMNVANYVNTNTTQTNCTWDNTNNVLTVNMTVSIGTINASRQFIITPRVVQGAISLATSTTTMSATPNPSGFGQSVTFIAIVTGSSGTPTGTVTFFDNGTNQLGSGNLGGGQATYATSSLSQGSHSITAVYSGDAQYNQSTSSIWTQTVNQASSSTTVSSSQNPSTYGSSITFTAMVIPSSATGTVTFKDGGTTLGSGTLSSGQATYTTTVLSVGSHSITAVYSGDTNDASSASSALSQTVNKGSTTITLSSSANPAATGQSVTFTAMVSPTTATGTVTFKDGGTTLGTVTLSGGIATYSTASLSVAGSPHSITAAYGGDTNDAGSTSSVLSQIVTTVTAAFSPTSGPVGTNIQVTGSGWALSDTISGVTVGGTTATNTLTVNSSGSLSGTITVPSTLGTGAKIIVITGIQTLAQTYNNAFTVTTASATFTPTSGPVGTSISVTGSGWATTTDSNISVTISGIAATDTLSINSSGAISGRITVPSGVTTKTVIINAAISGNQTFNNAFTLTTAAASFSPTSGPVGTIISVTGSGWPLSDNNYTVTVGGTTATNSLTANSSGALSGTITVPSISTGSQTVSITESISGIQIFSTNFTVLGLPTVTGISPNSGPTAGGTNVTINGTNFVTGATVTIGGNAATGVSVTNSTTITATTPAGTAGTVSVIVTTAGGSSNAFSGYTYVSPPTVTAISPSSGPTAGGTSVTITGTNFVTGATITIGGNAATGVSVNNSTTITATTPAGTAGSVNVIVTTAGGSGTKTNGYTYVAAPTVTAISPTSGSTAGGTSVTITGTNFVTGATVTIDGNAATGVSVTNSTTISATTPAGTAGTVSVIVTTAGGSSNAFSGYTYNNPAPTLSSISPTTGNRLQTLNVTFTGTNFISGVSSVNVGSGMTVNSTTVNSSTQIVASITIGATAATGTNNFSVTNGTPGGGTSATKTFTVSNPAPTLTGISPTGGSRNTTLNVVLTGTNYISGVSSVTISGSNITINSTTINSQTQITVSITIASNAATGTRTFKVTNSTPGGGTSGTKNFTVN
jgi:prepilin-type N-terminal cleavage/methylation domain-containing protein